MDEPLVSIIVRTRDRPLLLKEALKSIALQTYRPLEVCLVNDGGSDVDLKSVKETLGTIFFHYIRHETSKGRSAALNSGLNMAEGSYVGILDDDDIYYPGAMQILLDAAGQGERDLVYGQVLCKEEKMENGEGQGWNERILGGPFSFGKLLFENFIPTNALLFSKVLAERTGPFDEDFEIFEDWDWIIRAAGICAPFFVKELVGAYRIFSGATISGKGGEHLHRRYREKLLDKHIGKVTAGDFLDHVKRTVDGLVLQKEAIISQLKEKIEELREQLEELRDQVKIKTEWVDERDNYIEVLEMNIHDLERELEKVSSSLSWKLTKPLRLFKAKIRKG